MPQGGGRQSCPRRAGSTRSSGACCGRGPASTQSKPPSPGPVRRPMTSACSEPAPHSPSTSRTRFWLTDAIATGERPPRTRATSSGSRRHSQRSESSRCDDARACPTSPSPAVAGDNRRRSQLNVGALVVRLPLSASNNPNANCGAPPLRRFNGGIWLWRRHARTPHPANAARSGSSSGRSQLCATAAPRLPTAPPHAASPPSR